MGPDMSGPSMVSASPGGGGRVGQEGGKVGAKAKEKKEVKPA